MDKILLSLLSELIDFKKDEIKDFITRSFHLLAIKHGSTALWLTDYGIIYTRDEDEAQLDYPYEDWLQAAIQTSLEQHAIKTERQNKCQVLSPLTQTPHTSSQRRLAG